jgi:pimeloyl-ACP methyl ester carboxylesterase
MSIIELSNNHHASLPERPSFQLPPVQVQELDQPDIITIDETGSDAQVPGLRGRHIARRALAAAITIELVAGIYTWDVLEVNAQLKNTHASLVHVYDSSSPAHNDTMVVVMAGLGNRSAFETARALPTYDRMGDVEALIYDNKGVDPHSIAELVIQKAQAEKKRSLVLDGHSMGGLVAAAIAADIYAGNSGLAVKELILDCTPMNYESVKEGQRTAADTMLEFSHIPGILKSRIARFAVEMYARKTNYINVNDWDFSPSSMYASMKQVIQDKFTSKYAASGELLGAQLGMILDANIESNLRTLSDTNRGKVPPSVIFEQPRDVFNDSVVYDDRSRQLLEDMTTKAGLRLNVFYTEGGHANPIQAPDTYNTIAASIAVVVNQVPRINPNTLTLANPQLKPIPPS